MSTQDTTLPPPDTIRIELVNAIHTLASCFENSLYAFGKDAEARKIAEGDISHAMGIAAKYNQNGAAIAAQAPQPSPLIAVGEDGEGQENHCHECGAEPGQMCSDEEGTEHGRKVHAVRQAQQAQGVPAGWSDAIAELLTHIEDVVPDDVWPNISVPVWNRVSALLAPQAEPQPEREPTTWSRYVAGMIACYLKWPDDDERVEAVAGIIERRRWSDRRTKSEPLSHVESESLQWLERLCEPALYLDRLGPIRDYLRAHGIGTKGGE